MELLIIDEFCAFIDKINFDRRIMIEISNGSIW